MSSIVLICPGGTGESLKYDALKKALHKQKIGWHTLDYKNKTLVGKIIKVGNFMKSAWNTYDHIGIVSSSSGAISALYPAVMGDIDALVLYAPKLNELSNFPFSNAKKVQCDLLTFQGTEDRIVSVEQNRLFTKGANGKYVSLDGIGHGEIGNSVYLDQVIEWTVEFLQNAFSIQKYQS